MTPEDIVGVERDRFFQVHPTVSMRGQNVHYAVYESDVEARIVALPADRRLCLNLGCGVQPPELAERMSGIDRLPHVNPDILCDFDKEPLPLEDDSIEYVHSHMVLEHITNFLPLFEELHRVTKVGAILDLWTPWWASERTWGDPTHVRAFTFQTFSFVSRKAYNSGNGTTTMGQYLPNCDFEILHSVLVVDDGLRALETKERDHLIRHGVDVVRSLWTILQTVKPIRQSAEGQ